MKPSEPTKALDEGMHDHRISPEEAPEVFAELEVGQIAILVLSNIPKNKGFSIIDAVSNYHYSIVTITIVPVITIITIATVAIRIVAIIIMVFLSVGRIPSIPTALHESPTTYCCKG